MMEKNEEKNDKLWKDTRSFPQAFATKPILLVRAKGKNLIMKHFSIFNRVWSL